MVPHPTYTCEFCPHTCTQAHLIPHMISYHEDDMAKKFDNIKLRGALKTNHFVYHLKDKQYFICFGCSSFWGRKGLAVNHKCKNEGGHHKYLNKLLNLRNPQEKVEMAVNEVISTAPVNQDEIAKLRKEIEKLKAQLEKKNNILSDKVDIIDIFCRTVETLDDQQHSNFLDKFEEIAKENELTIDGEEVDGHWVNELFS